MRKKVTILFKSGNRTIVRAEAFTVREAGGRITDISWVNVAPRPMHMNVDEIEAVFCHD